MQNLEIFTPWPFWFSTHVSEGVAKENCWEICCETRRKEACSLDRETFCGLRKLLEFASGWYGDCHLQACCLADGLFVGWSFLQSAAFQHASGLWISESGVSGSETRLLKGLVAVRLDVISFSESGRFPLYLLGFAACCLWNHDRRLMGSGDLSSLLRFLRLNRSVLGLSYVSKSSSGVIALKCFFCKWVYGDDLRLVKASKLSMI